MRDSKLILVKNDILRKNYKLIFLFQCDSYITKHYLRISTLFFTDKYFLLNMFVIAQCVIRRQ